MKYTLEQIRELCERATPCSWEARFIHRMIVSARNDPELLVEGDGSNDWNDAELMAASHEVIPQLLDEVGALKKAIVRLAGNLSSPESTACPIEMVGKHCGSVGSDCLFCWLQAIGLPELVRKEDLH